MFLFFNVVRVKRKIGKVKGCELHLEVKRKIKEGNGYFLAILGKQAQGSKGVGGWGQEEINAKVF
jgi:hypothetical protein